VSHRVEQITRNASPMANVSALLSPCLAFEVVVSRLRPREDLLTHYEFKYCVNYKNQSKYKLLVRKTQNYWLVKTRIMSV